MSVRIQICQEETAIFSWAATITKTMETETLLLKPMVIELKEMATYLLMPTTIKSMDVTILLLVLMETLSKEREIRSLADFTNLLNYLLIVSIVLSFLSIMMKHY